LLIPCDELSDLVELNQRDLEKPLRLATRTSPYRLQKIYTQLYRLLTESLRIGKDVNRGWADHRTQIDGKLGALAALRYRPAGERVVWGTKD